MASAGADGTLDGIGGQFAHRLHRHRAIVGYDTTRDRRLGLYRLLMTCIFQAAIADGQNINLNKRGRPGRRAAGKPFIE